MKSAPSAPSLHDRDDGTLVTRHQGQARGRRQGTGTGAGPARATWNPTLLASTPSETPPAQPLAGQLRCPVQCMLANRCDRREAVTYKRTASPPRGDLSHLASFCCLVVQTIVLGEHRNRAGAPKPQLYEIQSRTPITEP
jgi:hypothetical protein